MGHSAVSTADDVGPRDSIGDLCIADLGIDDGDRQPIDVAQIATVSSRSLRAVS